MIDLDLLEQAIEGAILVGDAAVVKSHAIEPSTYGAGFDAGYVAGLRQALLFLHRSSNGHPDQVNHPPI
jgi:hypothetical protein